MQVKDILFRLELEVVAGSNHLNREFSGGYVSDLLSNVMGNASPGSVWITLQAHQNIVAVASLVDLAAIIIAGGIKPDIKTVTKAESENVILMKTPLSAYEAVGRLYSMENDRY